jgi:hypothetical protein
MTFRRNIQIKMNNASNLRGCSEGDVEDLAILPGACLPLIEGHGT